MVNAGIVGRVKHGVYFYGNPSQGYTMIDVEKIVPGGVLCLYSVWSHYNLTVQIPRSFNIAIEKSRKITVPDYPPLILYYWKQKYYEMGVITKEIGGYTVKIYDMEKSVCDAVKYRTKIGIETASERLKTKL